MIMTNPNLNGQAGEAHAAAAAKRRAARRWILIPIGFIAVQMSIVFTMMYVATSDPTFAVEPDYYEKALAWDATAAQHRTNERLGWRADVRAEGAGTAADLVLTLTTSDGTPLDGGVVSAELFSNVRAGERTSIALEPRGGGVYRARAPFDRAGMWECRLTVKRGPETFTSASQISVPGVEDASR
jgi:nitrogen fixation protein FixH